MKDIKSSKHSRIILAVKNFMAQGMLYMEAEEVVFRLALTSLFAVGLALASSLNFFVCLFVAHFLSYLLNGQFFVLLRYLVVGEHLDKEKINLAVAFLSVLHEKGRFEDVLVSGSGCRGEMSVTSDLDLRMYYRAGLKCYFLCNIALLQLRLYANWHSIPVDVYSFKRVQFLEKLDKREVPISFS